MNLYMIDREIAELMNQMDEVDPETGEVLDCTDEILARLNELGERRERAMQEIAKDLLNQRAGVAALKAEAKRLTKRAARMNAKAERCIAILGAACGGVKTDLGVATVRYTKTDRLDVDDSKAAIEWLIANGKEDCYRVAAPTVDKNAVKRLVKSGTTVPGVALTAYQSVSIK